MVQLNIDASQAIAQLEQVNQHLQQIATNTTRIPRVRGVPAQTLSTWDKLKKKIMENVKSLTNMNSIFQTIIGIQAVSAIGQVIKRTEALNNQFIALQQHASFRGIADDFERLGDITGGLSNKMQLLPSISKATAFGIDLSNGKLEKFVTLAQKLGIMMGKDVISSFDDLTIAVGRQSVMIADNLGIMIKKGEANEKWAKQNGIAVRDMTAMNKQQAFLNELLEKGALITENLDMSKMTMAGTAAVNDLELAMEKFKKLLAETMVDAGQGIGRFMFDLSNMTPYYAEQSKSLRRAEFMDQVNTLAKKKKADAMYIAQSTERYKEYFKEQSRFGINSAEINERYYQRFLVNAKGMSEDAIDMMQFMLKTNIAGVDRFITEMEDRIAESQKLVSSVLLFSENKEMKKAADKRTKEDEKKAERRKREAEKAEQDRLDALSEAIALEMEIWQDTNKLKQDFENRQAEKDLLLQEQKKKRDEDERLERIAKEKEMYFNLANVRNSELMLFDYQAEQRQKIKAEEHKILLKQEKEYQNKAKSYLIDAANNIYSGIINSRENFLQETIALSMQRAGAEIFNDGLQGLWQGGRWMLSPYPTMAAQGASMVTYSLAEMGAGVALGYAGAAAMPSTGGKSSEAKNKETAARDRLQNFDNQKKEAVVTYLYPDERTAIQQLSKINKKF